MRALLWLASQISSSGIAAEAAKLASWPGRAASCCVISVSAAVLPRRRAAPPVARPACLGRRQARQVFSPSRVLYEMIHGRGLRVVGADFKSRDLQQVRNAKRLNQWLTRCGFAAPCKECLIDAGGDASWCIAQGSAPPKR